MSGLDRQEAFSGTRPVSEALAFDEARLSAYLSGEIDGFRGPVEVRQFKGGQSNPTYLLTAASGRYVLRRKPPGKLLPSAHAVDREYRVMRALFEAGFPVPRPRLLCEDEAVVGTTFYVMDHVDGRIFWSPDMPGSDPQERAAVYDAMNETIARLHGFDVRALGLSDFGKPSGYVERQVRRWSQQYEASRTQDIPEMERLIAWLPTALPPEPGPALVHGDFRLDNLIVDSRRPKVLAVLDWELSTIGDPLADFAYHLMAWHMPRSERGAGTGSLAGCDLDALGIPGVDAYVSRYCERTGHNLRSLDFYFAYNFFRLAAILQGILGRVRDGTATSAEAAAMADEVGPLARTAWSFAERAGAR